MNETKLLPCPYCGEVPDVYFTANRGEYASPGGTWLVCCGTDACYGNAFSLDSTFRSKEHAVKMWNARAEYELKKIG